MGYTISIVDDEPRVRKGLAKLISSRGEAWKVSKLFSSGNTALEAARAERMDVILADIRMPGLDGLELANALHAASPDTVVVIMSGYKEFDYARRAMKVGVLDFIVKPIEEEELFAVLDRARAEVDRRKRRPFEGRAGPGPGGSQGRPFRGCTRVRVARGSRREAL